MNRKEIEKNCQQFLDALIIFIQSNHDDTFMCYANWDWNPSRARSRGGIYKNGKPLINMAMYPKVYEAYQVYRNDKLVFHYREYTSFNDDQMIGQFYTDNLIMTLKALICHEVAHVWVRHDGYSMIAHGFNWKKRYAILREKHINPYHDPAINTQLYHKSSIDIKAPDEDEDKKQRDAFLANCGKYGLPQDALDSEFMFKKVIHRVVGWNTRARKYYVILKREDGKMLTGEPYWVDFCLRNKNHAIHT